MLTCTQRMMEHKSETAAVCVCVFALFWASLPRPCDQQGLSFEWDIYHIRGGVAPYLVSVADGGVRFGHIAPLTPESFVKFAQARAEEMSASVRKKRVGLMTEQTAIKFL